MIDNNRQLIEDWHWIGRRYRHRAVEAEVSTPRPLLLNRPVVTALAVLEAEVHASGRSNQNDSEP